MVRTQHPKFKLEHDVTSPGELGEKEETLTTSGSKKTALLFLNTERGEKRMWQDSIIDLAFS